MKSYGSAKIGSSCARCHSRGLSSSFLVLHENDAFIIENQIVRKGSILSSQRCQLCIIIQLNVQSGQERNVLMEGVGQSCPGCSHPERDDKYVCVVCVKKELLKGPTFFFFFPELKQNVKIYF